jgi:glycosyltransferase involved in cell wall biosynthesis
MKSADRMTSTDRMKIADPMKIAIMAPLVTAIREPQRGGSQAFVSDLASGLAARGHDVHVYAADGSQVPGAKVIETGVDPRSLAGTLYRPFGPSAGDRAETAAAEADPAEAAAEADQAETAAAEAYRAEAAAEAAAAEAASAAAAESAFTTAYTTMQATRYDVIHNHAFDAPAVLLATALPAPVVHTLHLPPDEAVAAALRRACRGSRRPAVAAVSQSQARAWRRLVPVDAILPPYPPTRVIPWSATAGQGALFAGRLSPEKGAAEAIDIARAAGVPIEVYGDVYDAEYSRRQIDSRRNWPGVAVHQAVARTSLWQAMARAAVVLCPSCWDEPFGLAAAEAQACGTPVVAFSRGGLGEVIADGVTGFLVPRDDLRAATEAVAKAPGLSRRACREHAESRLDLEVSLDAHERLYRQVTGD